VFSNAAKGIKECPTPQIRDLLKFVHKEDEHV
jgi:hypothetical protein